MHEMSWAAGRTLRSKHLVLLAFAEVGIFQHFVYGVVDRQDRASRRKGAVFLTSSPTIAPTSKSVRGFAAALVKNQGMCGVCQGRRAKVLTYLCYSRLLVY